MFYRSSILSLLFAVSTLFLYSAQAQITINPQVGISASMLSTDPQGSEASARFGYQVGTYLRFGERVYFQPGIFWQRSGTELRTTDELDIETLKDDVDLDAIFISAGLGYNLIDSQVFVLRVNGGVAGTLILNVQDNLLGLELENFNGLLAGAPIGVGVDLFGILSADLSYEFGLTNVFDEIFGLTVDATNNVFRFNVGLVF
ncbi:MAG: outer membrane beta-barrel protein [Rhodothermales bacterium]